MDSLFFGSLVVEKQEDGLWRLDESLSFFSARIGRCIDVPVGFVTDFASIPRVLWSVVGAPDGEYTKAAVIHDYLYRSGLVDRATADKIFLDAMAVSGVGWWRRQVIYHGVRCGGWMAWRKHRQAQSI